MINHFVSGGVAILYSYSKEGEPAKTGRSDTPRKREKKSAYLSGRPFMDHGLWIAADNRDVPADEWANIDTPRFPP